jgi:hypothetical protein
MLLDLVDLGEAPDVRKQRHPLSIEGHAVFPLLARQLRQVAVVVAARPDEHSGLRNIGVHEHFAALSVDEEGIAVCPILLLRSRPARAFERH